MTNFYRIMLGKSSVFAAECIQRGFIGTDFEVHEDLSSKLGDDWRAFNKEFIPVFLRNRPDKTRVAAGLACGALWTVSKGISNGDIVLSPDGDGHYHVGEVVGDYSYHPGEILPHRRDVKWLEKTINRDSMSTSLKASTGSIGTVSNITIHAPEVMQLVQSISGPDILVSGETPIDPMAFALEKHLEDFLVKNWSQTELAKTFDIYQDDGERLGQQYPTDTGPIDILAVSKDKKTLLVIELKKGRASDVVVGQILRYMGYVVEVLAEKDQQVKGAIIALEDDQKIRRALAAAPAIEFYRYQVSFKLMKT